MPEPITAGTMVASGALEFGGDVLGAFLSYFGMKEQSKLTREGWDRQEGMFNQSRADERYQFDTTLSTQNRQFDRKMAMDEQTGQQNYRLGQRGYDIQEKQVDANIAQSKENAEIARKDKIMSGKMFYLNNLTRFFNTPETRSAFANLWK